MKRIYLAACFALIPALALAGSGTLTIGSVSGSSPGPYTVTMTGSVSGVTVGDDFGAKLSGGGGAVYRVTTVTAGSQQLTIADVRTSHNGAVYGPPATGSAWYATPAGGAADDVKLTKPPYTAVGWGEAMDLNAHLLSSRVSVLSRAGYGGSAPISSSTTNYLAVSTISMPGYTWDTDGAAVRITANLRQNTGSGVGARLNVGGTTTTAATIVGKVEWLLVREGTNVVVYTTNVGATCAFARDSVSGLNMTAAIDVSPQIVGSSVAGSTAMDMVQVERLR